MTEAEWLGCNDPEQLLEFLKEREDLRKWRLLGAALCRSPLPWHHLGNRPLTAEEWEATRPMIEAVEASADDVRYVTPPDTPEANFQHALDVSEMLHGGTADEKMAEAVLIRDVFGNSFRPVSISPAWQTPTIVVLAQAAYDNRTLPAGTLEPGRLTVLADALEEAGCHDTDILNHCRQPGEHVRGCWVLDLLLGKS